MPFARWRPRARRRAPCSLARAQQANVTSWPTPARPGPRPSSGSCYDPVAAWPSTLFWSYNPSGAPPQFANASVVTNGDAAAIGKWRASCNIDAAYAGTTTDNPEHSVLDAENGPQPDQINVLGWRPTPAGIAGYTVGYSALSRTALADHRRGRRHRSRRSCRRSTSSSACCVHEFGHVIGVNHSQFDDTLMSGPPYSNYNTLNTLATDDIRGCRCLYGAPTGVSTGLLCSIPPVVDFGEITAGESSQRSIQLVEQRQRVDLDRRTPSAGAAYATSGCGAGTTLFPGARARCR